jgi:NADH-quinone oxidoreductase subunit M
MLSMATGGMSLATDKQVLIFLGLFIGFAVKMGVFPLHGWMPLVYAEAPAAVTLISSGILLKMGAYGILRAVTTLPGAAIALQQSLTILAFVSLLYGALLAWKSRNLVVMAAYASISHMAVVLLGTATLNATGITGAALQMLGHGLAAGLLFLLLGLLAERLGSRELVDFEGLLQRAPRFAGLLILALVGSIGLPGTIGFISELQVMVGGYARWGGAIALLSVAVLIGAAYGLRVTNVILSPNTKPDLAPIADLGRAEAVAAGILLTGMIGLGFFPMPLLELLGQTAAAMGRLFGAVA